MPSSRLFLVVGVDPTSIPGTISKAELLQMFSASAPDSDVGYVIQMAAGVLPDTVSYPELTRFLAWDATNEVLYAHNGASWREVGANGAALDVGSVDLDKLAIGAGPALGQCIAVKADLSGFEKALVSNVLQDGTLGPVKLSSPGAVDSYCLTSIGGVRGWTLAATLKNYLGALDAANLPVSGATAGTYGGANSIPVLTVDTYGRITAATTVANPAITPVYAAAHAGVNTLTNGVPAQVVLVEDLDTSSMLASNQFTIPTTGVYEVNCSMLLQAAPVAMATCWITGATLRLHRNKAVDADDIPVSASFVSSHDAVYGVTTEGVQQITLSFHRMLSLTAADVLELWAVINGYPLADVDNCLIASYSGSSPYEYHSHISIRRIA